jgi:hypothetical protein
MALIQTQRFGLVVLIFLTVLAIYAFRINESSFSAFSQSKIQELMQSGDASRSLKDLSGDLEWSNSYKAYGLTNQLILFLWVCGVAWTPYRMRVIRAAKRFSGKDTLAPPG